MDCAVCGRSEAEHTVAPGMGCEATGCPSFSFRITRDGLDRMERSLANVKRVQAGEQFPHCHCLLDIDLTDCPRGCGRPFCSAHLKEHAMVCVPPGERLREPTVQECEDAAAMVRMKLRDDDARREMANVVYWMLAADETQARGYVQSGLKVNRPGVVALQRALKEAGFDWDGTTGPSVLFGEGK